MLCCRFERVTILWGAPVASDSTQRWVRRKRTLYLARSDPGYVTRGEARVLRYPGYITRLTANPSGSAATWIVVKCVSSTRSVPCRSEAHERTTHAAATLSWQTLRPVPNVGGARST
eukprot:3318881-Prymnesium_polylepis.1